MYTGKLYVILYVALLSFILKCPRLVGQHFFQTLWHRFSVFQMKLKSSSGKAKQPHPRIQTLFSTPEKEHAWPDRVFSLSGGIRAP